MQNLLVIYLLKGLPYFYKNSLMVRIIYQRCFYKNRSKIKKYFEAEYKRLDRFLKKPEKVGKFPDDNDALIVDISTISAMGTIENASPKKLFISF